MKPRTQRTSLVATGAVTIALAFQVPLSGCGDCTDDGVEPTYVIRVHDATSGGSICDATVLVNGSALSVDGVCRYSAPIPYNQPPTATIRVEHPDYQSAEKQVPTKWPSDSCGKALPVKVEFALVRL